MGLDRQSRTGLGSAGMWDLAMSPGQVQLPLPCDTGRTLQDVIPLWVAMAP